MQPYPIPKPAWCLLRVDQQTPDKHKHGSTNSASAALGPPQKKNMISLFGLSSFNTTDKGSRWLSQLDSGQVSPASSLVEGNTCNSRRTRKPRSSLSYAMPPWVVRAKCRRYPFQYRGSSSLLPVLSARLCCRLQQRCCTRPVPDLCGA